MRRAQLIPGEATAREADGPEAPLARTLAIARPAAARLALATLFGAGGMLAAIGLIATSAWLISRSAQHPQVSQKGRSCRMCAATDGATPITVTASAIQIAHSSAPCVASDFPSPRVQVPY